MAAEKTKLVRMKLDTLDRLKNLMITVQGVTLKSYDEKMNHLMWVYENDKKNRL